MFSTYTTRAVLTFLPAVTCVDLTINLQSFMFNVFGCLDNLARIWVIERNVTNSDGSPLRDNQVGFLRG